MNVSQQDASGALAAIDAVDRRVREAVWYREASPFLFVWGLVWLVANTITDLWPQQAGWAWLVGVAGGIAFTAVLTFLQLQRRAHTHAMAPASRERSGRRMLLLGLTIACFFPAMLAVLAPLSARQHNAFISLFWAFAYMAAGCWVGMRLFITGVVTAVAILVGFLFIREHYFLWMALVGGGSLLLAGFWFRRI
ncbi:MAG: hypothetical protein ABW278_01210 [Steroidobacteraceae bacterium]